MKLIIANWKLHPNKLKEAQKLLQGLNKVRTKNRVVICPPAVYLPVLKTKFELGSQDLFWEEEGTFTGQVSGSMLKQFGVKYSIVGHSERRALGETDEQVNLKIQAALRNKITPILCVGFGTTAGENDEDVMEQLREQLKTGLQGVDPSKVVVAYEPVWAISTGNPNSSLADTPKHAEKIAMFIKIKFKVKKVLYGGSTTAANAGEFLSVEMDGLLVGGSSLHLDQFSEIINS